MPKFVIEETVPTWITYRARIEAPTREAAIERFKSGTVATQELFGDVVDGVDVVLTVREA